MLNLLFWRATTINPMPKTLPITGQAADPSAADPSVGDLSKVQAGKQVKVKGFGKLESSQRQHLQAYGLLPGRIVQVLAQRPVTVILIEQTELAFETEIARQVFIE